MVDICEVIFLFAVDYDFVFRYGESWFMQYPFTKYSE